MPLNYTLNDDAKENIPVQSYAFLHQKLNNLTQLLPLPYVSLLSSYSSFNSGSCFAIRVRLKKDGEVFLVFKVLTVLLVWGTSFHLSH